MNNITSQFIAIETKPSHAPTLNASKFGGIPYWPISKPYPYLKGKPLKMMVQINFEEMSYHLAGFPKKGILQFFYIYADEMWGLKFDSTPSDINVVYHPFIEEQAKLSKELVQVANDNLP